MRTIDADDLYQKCIEIQLKKRNRYFDIDDVIKLIKKAPTVDVLNKIRAEIEELDRHYDYDYYSTDNSPLYKRNEVLKIINKYKAESEDKE